MKTLIIFNKNLHNKLHNGLKTQQHFLQIILKFKHFWNITRGVTREQYSGIIVEISYSHVYDVTWNLIFHE